MTDIEAFLQNHETSRFHVQKMSWAQVGTPFSTQISNINFVARERERERSNGNLVSSNSSLFAKRSHQHLRQPASFTLAGLKTIVALEKSYVLGSSQFRGGFSQHGMA